MNHSVFELSHLTIRQSSPHRWRAQHEKEDAVKQETCYKI